MSSCRISDEDKEDIKEMYTALHEGKTADELLCERWKKPVVSRTVGQGTEIQYKKKVPDEFPSYHHPWADQAQPTIYVTPDKQFGFYAGKYETTRRGIEDRVLPGMKTEKYLKNPYVQRERLPGVPSVLITLGTLEWVRYKYPSQDGWIERELRFDPSIAPDVAHDENGNLHVLGGRYVIDESGEVIPMSMSVFDNPRRRRHRRDNPFALDNPRRRHGRRRRHVRDNPAASSAIAVRRRSGETGGQRAMRMIMSSIIVGAVATATAVGMNMVLNKFTWGAGTKALTKVGVGLLGGIGLAALLPTVPSIAAGFSVGGVIDGFLDMYNLYVAPRLVSTTSQPAPAPSAQALMPGGIPRQYTGVSPAACRVGG